MGCDMCLLDCVKHKQANKKTDIYFCSRFFLYSVVRIMFRNKEKLEKKLGLTMVWVADINEFS